MLMVAVVNAMASLSGSKRLMGEGIEGCENDEKNLTNAFDKKEIFLAESIVIKEMAMKIAERGPSRADILYELIGETLAKQKKSTVLKATEIVDKLFT